MRRLSICLLVVALLLPVALPAAAEPSRRQPAPRIIFGKTEASDFRFREWRPLRRSDASTRQAYFGSGKEYSDTLARLQAQMSAIRQRQVLDQLALTPAQEAAKSELSPALVRALALSHAARAAAEE